MNNRSIIQKLSDGMHRFLNEKVIPRPHKDPHYYEQKGEGLGSSASLYLSIALLWTPILSKTIEGYVRRQPLLAVGVLLASMFTSRPIGKNIGTYIDYSFNTQPKPEPEQPTNNCKL